MKQLIFPMEEQYEEYSTDESRFRGHAESISFPESEEEVCLLLKDLGQKGIPITVQGGKTGIAGGAVPLGGHVMNLSRMNQVKGSGVFDDGTGWITVGPGINLLDLTKEINRIFRKQPMFWPPDPTETSATVGGIAATDAQGICRLLYGSGKKYVEKLRLARGDGSVATIKKADRYPLNSGESIAMMNAVLGKEGITGVITELTLKLLPKPESVWGITFFFPADKEAGDFIDMLHKQMPTAAEAQIAAVEYMDKTAIELIENRKASMTKLRDLPDVGDENHALVYIETHGTEEGNETLAEALMEMAMVCDSNPEQAWAVSGEAEIERMHAFRHGAAETANLFIEAARQKDVRITKLGTDMVPGGLTFTKLLACVRADLKQAGLNGSVFGHALENHLHVNILPKDYEEYQRGIELLHNWAKRVRDSYGQVAAEHGIGKLKQQQLAEFISPDYIAMCRQLKREFDCAGRINRDNIFPWEA